MPSDDLVLNVRQIAGYPQVEATGSADAVLIQRGSLGSPYYCLNTPDLVSTALLWDPDQPLQVGIPAPPDSIGSSVFTLGFVTTLDGWWLWNSYIRAGTNETMRLASGPSGLLRFDPITGWGFFFGPSGAAGTPIEWGPPQFAVSPNGYASLGDQLLLGRDPISPMEAATAQWVQASTLGSFNGRTGAVTLWIDDILCAGGAPIFSPVFQGTPRAITPPPWSNSSRLATTAFVQAAVTASQDLTSYAPLDSPNFTGQPSAPTAAQGSSNGQLATTAFVMNAVAASTAGVVSFNGRVGLVVLTAADLNAVGGALLSSPLFTGQPQAPTAAPGTSTAQLATCAFVMAAVAAATAGVASFNGRTGDVVLSAADVAAVGVSAFNGRLGAVSLLSNDISAAGGALLASPSFTGTPQAPTAAPGTSTAQLATCAFVMAAIGGISAGVVSFNGRAGAITLTGADLTGAGGALANAVVTSFNTRQGVVTLTAADLTAATPAPLNGVPNSSNAAPGQIGEYLFSGVPSTNLVVVGSASSTNITSISLTAGDWDVEGFVGIIAGGGVPGAGVTIGQCFGWINDGSATLEGYAWQGNGGGPNINVAHPTGCTRYSLATTTTLYLSFLAQFGGGNSQVGGYGWIMARRVR